MAICLLVCAVPQERVRAQELAMRERETQELLKMGTAAIEAKKKSKAMGKVRAGHGRVQDHRHPKVGYT